MNCKINILTAKKADIDGMCHLLEQLFSIEKDFSPDRERHKRGLNLLLADKKAVLFVAKEGDKVVGMCTLQFFISTAEGGKVALLEDLVVDKDWRGRGIGTALLKTAEQYCQKNAVSRITLLADKDNHAALNFYKKHHLQETNLIALKKFI